MLIGIGMPDDKIDLYAQNGKEIRALQQKIKEDLLLQKKLILEQKEKNRNKK